MDLKYIVYDETAKTKHVQLKLKYMLLVMKGSYI